ncbi:MAG: hypothetical protein RLY70_3764 [Planctomycetota bacterium]|jgi:hypothetical protein
MSQYVERCAVHAPPLRWWLAASVMLAIVLVFVGADVVFACPNCKDSLSQNDPTAMGIVQGYFWSIILMLSLPFIVLTGLSTYFYVLVRRARKAALSGGAPSVGSGAAGGTADSLEAVLAKSRLPRWSPTLDS